MLCLLGNDIWWHEGLLVLFWLNAVSPALHGEPEAARHPRVDVYS